jgi:CDP-diacylglycerol--serine O-phosphatidyltransferase
MEIYFTYIFPALILTNVLHMLVVKFHCCEFAAVPIHKKLFGSNKTWRGFFFAGFCNALLVYLLLLIWPDENLTAFTGLLFGWMYMISELPNSFIKRRLGIASGETHPKWSLWFKLADKMDSSLGVAILFGLIFPVNLLEFLQIFLINILVHSFLSFLLWMIRIKKSY